MEFRHENQTGRKNAVNLPRPRPPTTNAITTGAVSKILPRGDTAAPQVHPFANSTSKLELIPSSTTTTVDGINVEEEARLYDQLCRSYEDETDDVCPSLSSPSTFIGQRIQLLKDPFLLVLSIEYPLSERIHTLHTHQTQTSAPTALHPSRVHIFR